jgi:replicative DNA helicase
MSNHVFIEGYQHISHVVDDTNRRLTDIREGKLKPIKTSSKKEMDKIGGYFEGDQLVIAGRTGGGKTAKVIHMISDFANPIINPHHANNMIILFDSWEMPSWRNMLRMYSRLNEMSVSKMLDYEGQMQKEAFERVILASKAFRNYPIYFSGISKQTAEWERHKISIRKQFPDKLIINVVDHSRLVKRGKEMSEEARITEFMIAGMNLKVNYGMFNIFLSQMNRSIETSVARGDIGKATPIASDIFGSDGVFQCADIVMALHRPGQYDLESWNGIPTGRLLNDPDANDHLLIECLLKQRDGWTGNITMRHNLALNQIEDYYE